MTEAEWLCSNDPQRMLAWITCAGPSGDGERDLERWRKRPADGKHSAVCHALLAPLGGEPGDYPQLPADWLRGWLGASSVGSAWPEEALMVANLLREVLGNPWRENAVVSCPVRWLTPTVLGIARRAYDERDFAALPVLADALDDAGCDSEDLLRHLRGQERCWCAGSDYHLYGFFKDGRPNFSDSLPCSCDRKDIGWRPLRGPHVRGCWALDTILGKDGAP